MNANKIGLLIGIPGAIVAISTIYDLAQKNPILNLEVSLPLGVIILSLAGSFGLGVLVLYLLKHRKKWSESYVVGIGSTLLGRQLREKYGAGFTDDDELIIEAFRKGNEYLDDLVKFTNLPKKHVKERLKFMEDRDVSEITFYDT